MTVRGLILQDLQKLMYVDPDPVTLTVAISGVMEDFLKWAKWMHTQDWDYSDFTLEEFYQKFKKDMQLQKVAA